MESGILTKDQEQKLSQMADDVLVFKNVILELVDGYLAKVLITLLDDKVVDKLKEDVKIQLAGIVDAAFAEDIELVKTLSANLINSLVDIPGLDETSEGLIFRGAIDLAVGVILAWIAKRKGVVPVTLVLKAKA
jgi:hypothetical protein